MAGDWIKMRSNLWDDPRIAKLCDLTDCGEAAVIGGLYWLWSTADQHSEDGIMAGMTMRSVDRKTGIAGIADALVSIGWLADHPEGVRLVNFDDHNGASAKSRAQTARRVANHKNNAPSVSDALPERYQGVTTPLPREEKRREENTKTLKSKTIPPDGDLFDGIDPQIASDFKALKNKKKSAVTKTSMEGIRREADKAGLSLADALMICCERGWAGFKAEWVTQPSARASPARESRHSGFDKIDYSEGVTDGRIG